MCVTRWMFAALIAAGLLTSGCNNPAPPVKTNESKKEADHDHDDHDHGEGPHGGAILEFGKYHGEFTVNHDTKEVTVYILSGNLKKAAPIDVPKLLLSIKKPAFQVDLMPKPVETDPKGLCSRFVAKHDNFGVHQEFEGVVSGEVAGKPYAGDFKEKPEEKSKK